MAKDYQLHMEADVEATPEQVWETIATGPGIDSWYMGHTELEEREGGAVRTDLGGHILHSVVTAWEPGRRFGYRTATDGRGSFIAVEWLVEGVDGGSTVLRSVGSGFLAGDDWESEFDALRKGGAFYFHNLTQWLRHFPGRRGEPVAAAVPWQGGDWQPGVREALGIPAGARTGDPVRLSPAGLPRMDGVLDYDNGAFLGVRAATGLYRFFPMRDTMLTVGHHLVGPPDPHTTQPAWQAWLEKSFT